MRFLRDIPIRRKLMIVILLTCAVAVLLARAAFFAFEYYTFRQVTIRHLYTLGEIVGANSTAALAFRNQDDATEVLSALRGERHISAAGLYDPSGRLFAKYPADLPASDLPALAGPAAGYHFYDSKLAGFQAVIEKNRPLGTLYLEYDTRAVMGEWLRVTATIAVVVIALVLLAAYVLSLTLQKQISLPILALADTAKRVTQHRDYTLRATKQGEDELGFLTDSFNQMLAQIGERDQALRESEARVRAVLDSALSAVVVINVDGAIIDWNARAEKMFGWSRAEALGLNLADSIIPHRYREGHNRGMRHYLATGAGPVLNRSLEMSALRRDGSEFPVELSINPLRTGDVVTFCGFVTDITERKHAEDQIKTTLKEVSDLKAAMDEHAIVAITNPQGRITYVNDKFCAISKYSREELIGQDHRIVNSGHHPSKFIRNLWTTIARGQVWHGEICNRAKDGSAYWVDTTIVPFLDAHGKPYQYVAIRADITERKRAEEELGRLNRELEARVASRTAQLETANQELEAFSYSVSHDLRAPLRHIDGFSSMLASRAIGSLDEKSRHYLTTISEAARRMGQLIDDLLTFSRIGRAELHHATFNLNQLVEDVRKTLPPDPNAPPIDWKIDPLPDVQGDAALVRQVFANLIDNAVKYSRKNPHPRIEIGCLATPPGEIGVFVRDNGAGFDMKYANKLFGVFQRLHSSAEFEGTGVGLANVRRIVQRHGGRIWAEAKVDEGATFSFTLPAEVNGSNHP